MKIEIIRRMIHGIAYGGINSFIALTILMIAEVNPPVSIIWLYTLSSFILGIYFGLASFIFEIDAWSPLKQTIVHYSSSLACYFIVAFLVGWVPLALKPIFLSTIFFSLAYSIFWLGYRAYYKKVEATMNESLTKQKE